MKNRSQKMTSGGREEGQIDNDGQKEKVLAKAEL